MTGTPSIPPVIKLSSPATREFWEIPVLHDDGELLAVDKPAGLLVSPDRYDPERANLMRLVHRDIERGAPWVKARGVTYLANVHRLDFETSGVLLLARSKSTLTALANQFGAEQPHKTYHALICGVPVEDQFEVNARIAPHPTNPALMRCEPKRGKKAVTRFEVLERFQSHAWVRCTPLTGRTHQIRVHLRFARYPIVSDHLYRGGALYLSSLKKDYRLKPGAEERPLMLRVALHASSLQVVHPVSGEPVTVQAPLPRDLLVALKYLRRYSSHLPSLGLGPVGPSLGLLNDEPEAG